MDIEDGVVINDDQADTPMPEEAPPEPKSAVDAAREAYTRQKEDREAGDDPEKIEQLRVQRAKDGRFVERRPDGTEKVEKTAQTAPEGQEKPLAEKQQTEALVLKPPPGWNAKARADYAALPPHIQQAVAQREVEVNKGLAKLAEYKGLEEFTPYMQQSGLTHAQVMRNAVEWERSLQQHPVHTVMEAARLGKVNMVELSKAILAQAGQRAPQGQQPQPFNPAVIDQRIEQHFAQRAQQEEYGRATTAAQRFLNDPKNVHAEAVVDEMVPIIASLKERNPGLSSDELMAQAYDMACYARPDIRELLINQRVRTAPSNSANPQRVHQARAAARATTGAPPSRTAPEKPQTYASAADAARAAYQAAIGAA